LGVGWLVPLEAVGPPPANIDEVADPDPVFVPDGTQFARALVTAGGEDARGIYVDLLNEVAERISTALLRDETQSSSA
jgi:hypothetical protein